MSAKSILALGTRQDHIGNARLGIRLADEKIDLLFSACIEVVPGGLWLSLDSPRMERDSVSARLDCRSTAAERAHPSLRPA